MPVLRIKDPDTGEYVSVPAIVGDTGPQGPPGPKGDPGEVGGDISNAVITFTESTDRSNIETGESATTIFGKIKKWFNDLKTVAFTGSYNDLIDTPTSLPADGGNADTIDDKHASDFMNRYNAGAISTFDTFIEAGVYRVQEISVDANGPIGMNQYGQLLVLSGDNSDTITQIYCNFDDNKMFSRSCHNWGLEPSNWTSWSKVNDGGNAATVGGVYVNNLIHQIGRQTDTTIINDNNYKTSYECSFNETVAVAIGLPFCWWHLKYFKHEDQNGFGVQMAFPLNNGSIKPMYRLSDGLWHAWQYFADGGNADTVDNLHVDYGTRNTYGLRSIAMDTFDLQAGVTGMSPGHIYIMYE